MNACLIWDHYSGYYRDPVTVTVLFVHLKHWLPTSCMLFSFWCNACVTIPNIHETVGTVVFTHQLFVFSNQVIEYGTLDGKFLKCFL